MCLIFGWFGGVSMVDFVVSGWFCGVGSVWMVCLCWFCNAGSLGVSTCVGVFVCMREGRRWWGREDAWVGFVDGEKREKRSEMWN